MAGTAFRNLRMFGKLCSDTPASKVMLDQSSRTARFGTTEKTAYVYLIQQLLSGNSVPSTTLIQEETVDLRREPVETEALRAKKTNNAKMEADLKKEARINLPGSQEAESSANYCRSITTISHNTILSIAGAFVQ